MSGVGRIPLEIAPGSSASFSFVLGGDVNYTGGTAKILKVTFENGDPWTA